jgi:lipopolysaccharide/colanic/teichoic acid biosynthesis glycosyltransferase
MNSSNPISNNSADYKVRKVTWWYFFVKRCFDLFNSLLAIILLSPVLLISALLVVCTSKGPVLFKDKRIGKDGKVVKVLKFRSMYIDSEEHPEKYFSPEQLKRWQTERKVDKDPRITKVGRFLRKTSIDELPQLFNIFLGTMSIVGPRPITQAELDEHFNKEQQAILLSVRPGLTGYWQVYGRSESNYASGNRVRQNMYYFEKRSLMFDLKLIILTVPAVLKHKGAQ